jgi:hypothetical protein
MNEQIKRLATEARLLTGWSVGEVEYQKFAELIVRECANVANSGIDPAESHLIGNDILEHFGVEE